MTKTRGFEVVSDQSRVHKYDKPNENALKPISQGDKTYFVGEVQLPTRSDTRSAGYDFYLPCDITILPHQELIIATDVKAYMLKDEVLKMYVRSSIGIKHGIVLTNQVGIIDSSYYSNEENDGNIMFALHNTRGKAFFGKFGERIAQGVFQKYLIIDNDEPLSDARVGGVGSSGK